MCGKLGLGVQRWVSDNSHGRCGWDKVVMGRMYGNRDVGESLDHCLLYIILLTPGIIDDTVFQQNLFQKVHFVVFFVYISGVFWKILFC